jgi:hypothetical protein
VFQWLAAKRDQIRGSGTLAFRSTTMAVTPHRTLLSASHLVAAVIGFGAVAAYYGHVRAGRMFGTPERGLGGALSSLQDGPTREAASRALALVPLAKPALGEPAAAVITLRLLAIAARVSGDPLDLTRAADACRARRWPSCDRESVLDMGASR